MKKNLKSFLTVVLAAMMLFSFAACTRKGPGTDTGTSNGTGTTGDYTYKPFDSSKKYTYLDAVAGLTTNWNPHTYQTSDDNYLTEFIRVGFYNFIFNDASNSIEGKEDFAGYKIIPEMAASTPVDVTETIKSTHPQFGIPESATIGYAYTIDLNQKATWQNGTKINADTYVYSMQKLLDSKLKNYRATDYYASDFCIAGAESFANSGLSVKKANSLDGDALTYEFDSIVKGNDGTYSTSNGEKLYFGLKDETYGWLGGDTLEYYKTYFPDGVYDQLLALADDEGYVPVTDASIALLYSFTGSDFWGNEAESDLAYYLSFDFTYPEVSYDTVGLYKTGEYQITLVLAKSLTGFDLLYNLTSNWIVYEDLYEANLKQVGDTFQSSYNTSVATTMSYGPYKLVEYQEDSGLRLERNTSWYGYTDGKHQYVDPEDGYLYDMYMTTNIYCRQVAEANTRKQMFLKGELMGYGLQAEDMEVYRGSDYCYATPSETIFFLILNGYLDAINQREANEGFDQTKFDLQTLTLTSFKKALAVTYDKELFASTISPARSGGYGIIGNAYIYDPDTGARYRDTDQAKKALCDFYSVDVSKYKSLDDAVDSITGYDPVTAKALFKEAFDEAIEKGFITDSNGDGKCDQTLRIEYAISADSDFMTKTVDYLNSAMAKVIEGTPFEGKIEFFKSAPYGDAWANKIRDGASDTVLGGWSGSALNPFSLTDLYVNPDRAYDGKWFNGNAISETIKIDGKDITMTLKQWSDALNGTTVTVDGKEYNFGSGIVEIETRLDILAALEVRILNSYDYLPMLQDASMALLSKQVYYVVEEYNPIMGRGGITYLKYNYDDAAWKDYVASVGGELSY